MIHSPGSGLETRPRSVTLIGWGVLLVGLANIWRSAGLIRQIDLLRELDVTPDPMLRLVLSIAWAVIFTLLAAAIWRRQALVRWLVPLALILYVLYRLGISSLSAVNEGLESFWLWLLAFVILILFSIWSLNRPPGAAYFAENNI